MHYRPKIVHTEIEFSLKYETDVRKQTQTEDLLECTTPFSLRQGRKGLLWCVLLQVAVAGWLSQCHPYIALHTCSSLEMWTGAWCIYCIHLLLTYLAVTTVLERFKWVSYSVIFIFSVFVFCRFRIDISCWNQWVMLKRNFLDYVSVCETVKVTSKFPYWG